ncbi:uncharacterized protein G2W53_039594 [Senna tora]|uniref:Uncharacterized protein n=1 Tax=Senna tora TaxID=362788 RepID=A0A834SQU3_9FABA|nr:uncharacterized protein G2W53_039594 [Senna tora]
MTRVKAECTFECKDTVIMTRSRIAVHVMKKMLSEHEDVEPYVVYIKTTPQIDAT